MKMSFFIIFLIILIGISVISCYSANRIKGSGNIISENRELTNFSSINGNVTVSTCTGIIF